MVLWRIDVTLCYQTQTYNKNRNSFIHPSGSKYMYFNLEEEEDLDKVEFNDDWKFAFEKLSRQMTDQVTNVSLTLYLEVLCHQLLFWLLC